MPVCRQSKFARWQQLPRRGSSLQGGVPQLRSNKQANGALLRLRMDLKRLRDFHTDYNIQLVCYIGIRILETMLLQ